LVFINDLLTLQQALLLSFHVLQKIWCHVLTPKSGPPVGPIFLLTSTYRFEWTDSIVKLFSVV